MINNQSLKSLHLSKKKLNDTQGVILAGMLRTKTNLIKLELEGNLLGPKTALEFGKVLKEENKTLRYLDMENNFLTNTDQSYDEVKTLADSLEYNKTLLHLNLGNNSMSEE